MGAPDDGALSSRWLPLILLHGAPPQPPNYNRPNTNMVNTRKDLHKFADYVHDLAVWTNNCRDTYMEWENIPEDEWMKSYNRCNRDKFEKEFLKWAYKLERDDGD